MILSSVMNKSANTTKIAALTNYKVMPNNFGNYMKVDMSLKGERKQSRPETRASNGANTKVLLLRWKGDPVGGDDPWAVSAVITERQGPAVRAAYRSLL